MSGADDPTRTGNRGLRDTCSIQLSYVRHRLQKPTHYQCVGFFRHSRVFENGVQRKNGSMSV
ncbi:Histone-lysine N-methyltransferase ASHH3 (ASH1 homolog 3) (Protein SET DOMAIN GROUP 7) (fragment) [Bradyrhizobium sp. STM 3843]